mgnify:CR=1 FL=1
MIKLDPNVAWERVAEPQADLSDVEILQKVAHDLYGYTPRQPAADAMTMMGGRVEVKLEPPMNYENIVRFTREELDQSPIIENLDHILSLTSCYETIAEFLDAFHPTRWARAESNSLGYGCACGPMKNPASGAIEVQSTCAHLTAGGDGLTHEVWHQRIFTSLPAKGLTAEIECEARDREQIDRLVAGLRAKGYDLEQVELG